MNKLDRLAAADARRDIQNDPDLGNLEETVGGDWQVKGRDADLKLLKITPDVIDAARETHASFHKGFPGWQLHSRINRDDCLYDRTIQQYGILMARLVSRATKLNGKRNTAFVRKSMRRGKWIEQCGVDAVEFMIKKKYTLSAIEAASLMGVDDEMYSRLRSTVALFMVVGFENYMDELRLNLLLVERENRKQNLFFA